MTSRSYLHDLSKRSFRAHSSPPPPSLILSFYIIKNPLPAPRSFNKKQEALTSEAASVPYRASALTKLLKDSLGGTARTLLIAACDGAAESALQTAGVLRFAQRVKRVTNTPTLNDDPKDAM
jgi:hypothetical protein